MTILADYHLHSNHSGDSGAKMEDMVLSAINKGLKYMCFTDHMDFDYPYGPNDTPGMFELNADRYIYEAACLKEKYAGQIGINIGLELGLQPHLIAKNTFFTISHEYDFIIGSSHVCNGIDPYNKAFFEGRTDEEAYRAYFQSILDNISAFDNYDVYGHLDYVVRYGQTTNKDFSYAKYADILDEVLKNLIEHQIGLECNTKGYAKGLNQPNPCFDILKRYRELGGEIITIGSDAHSPEEIGASFDLARDVLLEAGFHSYSIFDQRIPKQLPLE